MNRTALALGMTSTTFKNAHGLTENGHMSTARDMSILGRHVLYDYPGYYNLFSRTSADAGITAVSNTNRRLLAAYKGADGIKTGYTRAAGFNLVASAERGQERIIATVFGGTSTSARNARVAELLDMGFKRAPSRATLVKPALPTYSGGGAAFASAPQAEVAAPQDRVLASSLRPRLRPQANTTLASADPAVAAAVASVAPLPQVASAGASTSGVLAAAIESAVQEAQKAPAFVAAPAPATSGSVSMVSLRPTVRPSDLIQTPSALPQVTDPVENLQAVEVVTRLSTSGGRQWGVNVGRFSNRYLAERALVTTALTEMSTLDGTLRKVVKRSSGYDANFLGMTQESAELACRRLEARNVTCTAVGPES
jgi:D-alanyl-D-alanine carboxypeptidase